MKIRSAGGVDLHLKGWKKKEYAEFSFSTTQTPAVFRLVYPTNNYSMNSTSAFKITLDLIYRNNSF